MAERSHARPRRAGPRGPALVGREDELALLEDEYAQAAAGQFRCVLLVGDPGVGKTRLAAELLGRHTDRATALQARAQPMATTVAFGLWAEALDPYLQVLGDDEVTDLCGGFLDDLAGLFHRVAAVRGSAAGGEAPRPRLLAGLTRMIDDLAGSTPVIVLLDDVHWADASSWEVLRHLARRLDAAPLMVVATARPIELAEQEMAAQVLFELDQDGLLTRLDVRPLKTPGLRALAEGVTGAPPPAALVDWLTERSCGNALFAIGLLRALLEEGADLSRPRLRRLPESLSERVAARVRRVEADQLATLEMLAVAGSPTSLGDLVALTGRPLEELGPILAYLVGTRGVLESERGRALTYEISHPLVRDVIYDQIGGARRRLLHRQAGRMLRDAGRIAEAALHYARSADPGDDDAVDALLEAMREAEAREAVREALMLLAELVELLPPHDGRWLDVLDAMHWEAEWVVDHRADAHAAVAVRALRSIDALLAGSAHLKRRAVVAFRLASLLAWGTGELVAAQEACERSRRLFEELGDRRQALLAARELAFIRGLHGDLTGMQSGAEEVARAAEAVGERAVAMRALAAVAYSATHRGRFTDAAAAGERAAAIARSDEKAFRLIVGRGVLASRLGLQGETAEAFRELDGSKQSALYRDTILPELEAFVCWVAGSYPAAVAAARDAAAAAPGPGVRRRVGGMIFGALAAIEVGDPSEAQRQLNRALDTLGGRDWFFYLQLARYAEGLLDACGGCPAASVTAMRAAASRLGEMGAGAWTAFVLADLAEAAAEAQDAVAARAAADELESVAAALNRPLHYGLAATAAAWAGLAAGDRVRAAAAARASVQHLSTTGCSGLLGRAHDALGRSLAGTERAAGVAALEEAARLFEVCGASWRRGRTLEALRRAGGAGRRARAAALGPGSLTRRERDVARLAAQGRTARAIAEALFVGERTVESHLASVYAKLGVESKLDLVRRAAELGLT